MMDVLAAEWFKTRTARSTRYILGVIVLFVGLMVLLAWYFVATWDSLPPERRANSSLGSLLELMGWIASLCMAVFGTLSITSEYSSGMIRTTFIAMPQRVTVLAAKTLVVGAVTFVATLAALMSTLLLSAVIIGGRQIIGQHPLAGGDFVLVLAMGLATTMFAMIGLGLGAITRSAIASIVSLAILWYVIPLLATHAPTPLNEWLTSLVPGALAGQLVGTGNANSVFGAALPPLAAVAAMIAYATIPLFAAAIAIGRRDT